MSQPDRPVDPAIVLVTHTIMDGAVVRWYKSTAAVTSHSEFMSASRNGVLVNTYLHKVPATALSDAHAVYEELRGSHWADVSQYATHRRTRLIGGEIEAIPGRRQAADA